MKGSEQPKTIAEPTEPTSTGRVTSRNVPPVPAKVTSTSRARAANGIAQSVRLHIEELVLHGFNAPNRYRIGESFEREMTRLFTERGVDIAIGQAQEMAHLDGVMFEMQPGSSPEVIGTKLARAIYGGLRR